MSDETFSGSTQDPVALLQQLIGHVASLRREMGEFREEIRAEVQAVRAELKQEIQTVRAELKEEIQAVRTELKEEIQSVRTELKGEIQAARQDSAGRLDGIRYDVRQFLQGTEKREEAMRTWLEESYSRKSYLYTERMREEWEPRVVELERRVYSLEEAEYRRKQDQKG